MTDCLLGAMRTVTDFSQGPRKQILVHHVFLPRPTVATKFFATSADTVPMQRNTFRTTVVVNELAEATCEEINRPVRTCELGGVGGASEQSG
jgi:hypothetical protein